MASVEFIYNGISTIIQCLENQKMEEICNNFIKKVNINENEIYYFYDGKGGAQFNKQLTFSQTANSIDKSRKKMNILVYNIRDTNINDNNNSKMKTRIICPQCKDDIRISIKNYKINLFKCKNGHTKNDILFNQFENTQKIDLMNIKCDSCKENNKYNTYQNQFYKCIDCNINLCPLCRNNHDVKHNICNYDKINIICTKHHELFTNYCKSCEMNICYLCEDEHDKHEIILLRKMMKDKKELTKNLDELKKSINLLKDDINIILDILNKVKDNLDNYYKLEESIFNNYDKNERNYEILFNINELCNFNNVIIKDVNNENNIETKILNIYDIYSKITNNVSIRQDNVLQYVKKIKDLEEQLRKKNLEITKLKDELLYIKNEYLSNIIDIIFRVSSDNYNYKGIIIKAFNDDEFGFVQKKFLKKVKLSGDIHFIFNAKNVNPVLTISEIGISNNANVFVVGGKIELKNEENINNVFKSNENSINTINLIFKTIGGKTHNMLFSKDISICFALQKYLITVGRKDLIDSYDKYDKKILFLYNARKLSVKDNTSLKDIFKIPGDPIILVNDINSLI